MHMNLDLPTQPIPEPTAKACAWLSAAERHDGPGATLEDRVTAGDLLDTLTETEPPYPPIDQSRPTVPLAEAAPHVIAALERHLANDLATAERIRIAGVLTELRRAVR